MAREDGDVGERSGRGHRDEDLEIIVTSARSNQVSGGVVYEELCCRGVKELVQREAAERWWWWVLSKAAKTRGGSAVGKLSEAPRR